MASTGGGGGGSVVGAVGGGAGAGLTQELNALEHPLLKCPVESVSQAVTDCRSALLEVQAILETLDAVASAGESVSIADQATAAAEAIAVIERLQSGRLARATAAETRLLSQIETRIAHIKQGSEPVASQSGSDWRAMRTTRVLVDHMAREGCDAAACALVEASGADSLVNTDVFVQAKPIEQALRAHDCGPALAWCAANSERLTRLRSTLAFRLRLQQFIELVRAQDTAGAVAHAGAHFPPHAARHLSDVQAAMVLLAVPSDTPCERYARLLNPTRWDDLAQLFRNNALALAALPKHGMLTYALQTGLAALKTPTCFERERQHVDCPVCAPNLMPLAASLPRCVTVNSQLVCAVTGELMDEDNPPTMMPNGNVYSRGALQTMWERTGKITCPRTGDECSIHQLKRVFIM
eukprot:UC1_evm3s351